MWLFNKKKRIFDNSMLDGVLNSLYEIDATIKILKSNQNTELKNQTKEQRAERLNKLMNDLDNSVETLRAYINSEFK